MSSVVGKYENGLIYFISVPILETPINHFIFDEIVFLWCKVSTY